MSLKKPTRKKHLPKFKIVLSNPTKNKCPSLREDEVLELARMIRSAITVSGQEAREFAVAKQIHIGLASSLRAINNKGSSCVLISQNVKPRHLISMIARNVEALDETVPVYVQPELSKFVENIFGIGALALVFPKDISVFGADIVQWITARSKPKIMPKKAKDAKKETRNIKTKSTVTKSYKMEATEKTLKRTPNKTTSGDFISFSSSCSNSYTDVDQLNLEEDRQGLISSLSHLVQSAKETPAISDINADTYQNIEEESSTERPASPNNEIINDIDDFLQEYKSLVIHKIRPNLNKISKNKKCKINKKK